MLTDGYTVATNMKTDLYAMSWAIKHDKFVRVDRTTEWGNPFLIPDDGDRNYVCDCYEKYYFPYKTALNKRLYELKGKALGCWCSPLRCHAHLLKDLADASDVDLLIDLMINGII